jgi:hypothetical protein
MIVAVDLDGMLIAYPEYFKFFFKAYQSQGAKVGILSARPASEKDFIEDALNKVGIKPDFVMLMPDDMKQRDVSPGIFKAIVCNELGVDVIYDDFQYDDNKMMGDFFTYNQRTKPFTSFAYDPEPVPTK